MIESPLPLSLRRLLGAAIDYAGLYPPAGLPMDQAVANYEAYLVSADRWALGRFVSPAARLAELGAALDDLGPGGDPWRVSVTLGPDWDADARAIEEFHHRSDAKVDAVEGRVLAPAAVDDLAARFPGITVYGEVSLASHGIEPVLDALAARSLAAKARLGGVTADAFPSANAIAAFLVGAAERGLPFKATAGLHHLRRGRYPLTYERDSPVAPMYGYLNLAVAAALAETGAGPGELEAALLAEGADAVRVEGDDLRWRDRRIAPTETERLRSRFHGFGSCSFREPLDEAVAAAPVS